MGIYCCQVMSSLHKLACLTTTFPYTYQFLPDCLKTTCALQTKYLPETCGSFLSHHCELFLCQLDSSNSPFMIVLLKPSCPLVCKSLSWNPNFCFLNSVFICMNGSIHLSFVQLCWVVKIHLENPPSLFLFFLGMYLLFRCHYCLPCKPSFGQRFNYRPTIKVVCVKVLYLIFWFAWVAIFYIRIVYFCITVTHHRYSSQRSIPFSIRKCKSISVNSSSCTPVFSIMHSKIDTAMHV